LRPVKVALVHNAVGGRAGGGGGVRQMLGLGRGLLAAGHEVVVVCHDYEPTSDFSQSDGFEVRAVQTGGVAPVVGPRAQVERVWRGMAAVAKLIPADVDAINAHEWPALRAGALGAKRTGARFAWTRNDESYFERAVIPDATTIAPPRARTRLLLGAIGAADLPDARRADDIVVLDTRNAEMVRRAYRRDAVIVRSGPADWFHDPPPRAEARARLGIADGTWLVAGVGILMAHRRFEDLIEATAELRDDAGVKALIVGDDRHDVDYADRLTQLIADRGLEERVTLPRRSVTDDELRDVYAAADAFVFPNRRQTWGLAPLEALAAGTPVVVSRGAGVHEVLEGRPGVEVVPAEQPAEIAAALRRLRSLDRAVTAPTREWIREEFNDRRYAERMAEILAGSR
jgi:glycosyltransferase involved in cell wall biosynthesis